MSYERAEDAGTSINDRIEAAKEDGFVSIPIKNDSEDEGDVKDSQAGKNGIGGTALAIISTIMGGGIVSIPYAYAVAGFVTGFSVQVIVIISIWISCVLYLQTRNILRCNTTFGTIANLCLGSASGIILNSLIVAAVFGILALYMILFSEIAISLVESADSEGDNFLYHKTFFVVILSILMAPIIVRKRIQELKLSTYVLFIGVLSLMVLLTAQLISKGSYASRQEAAIADASAAAAQADVTPVVMSAVASTGEVSALEGVVDSVNIAVASQGFVIALFPIYSSMAKAARPKVMTSITSALLFTMSTYTLLSLVSIKYFGQDNIEPSIF